MVDDGPPSARWERELLGVWREAQKRSMVGPGDPRTHLDHARRLASFLDPPGQALDLGSGAGIPGLALAGLWPTSRWTLLDAARRRVALLRDAVERLGWGERVVVVHGRAEELGRAVEHRERYDLVTARSFGPPAVTAECGGAFVRIGGLLAVTEPPASKQDRWPEAELAVLGLVTAANSRPDDSAGGVSAGGGGERAPVHLLVRTRLLDGRFPRRPGAPSKRPLY